MGDDELQLAVDREHVDVANLAPSPHLKPGRHRLFDTLFAALGLGDHQSASIASTPLDILADLAGSGFIMAGEDDIRLVPVDENGGIGRRQISVDAWDGALAAIIREQCTQAFIAGLVREVI